MRSQHVWKEKDAEGRKREVRVTKFGKQWRFQAKLDGDEQWTYYERPTVEDLTALRDIVFRKYQRRRASFEDVESLDSLLRQYSREEP